jgi:ABC-type phosphate transport system substrate-binding protein
MRDRRSIKAGLVLALFAALMLLPACGSSANTDGAASDDSVSMAALDDNARQPSAAGTDQTGTSADGDVPPSPEGGGRW